MCNRLSLLVCSVTLCLSLLLLPLQVRADAPDAQPKLPGTITVDISHTVSMTLALIPAGTFMMGSPVDEKGRSDDEGPQHAVTISEPFYLGAVEVTQAQYEEVMGKNPSEIKGGNLPVDRISWDDANTFCRKLSKMTGKEFDLPTEAQWEYACRAGTTTRFSFGEKDEDLGKFGNFCDKSCRRGFTFLADHDYDDGADTATPVGSYKPNAWSLYDMHGNVWEWCQDWYSKDSYRNAAQSDPMGVPAGTSHVIRGGSWYDSPSRYCRSAYRTGRGPGCAYAGIGMRVVMRPPQLKTPRPTITLDLGNNVQMRFALIPAGTFMMGMVPGDPTPSPEKDDVPQHKVTISHPFYMSVYEVTQEQYQQIMGTNPSQFKGEHYPVTNVYWADCSKFCTRLSQQTGLLIAHMPTEAQWEYACRAGTTTRYSFGDNDADFYKYGNYADKSNSQGLGWQDRDHNDGYDRAAPVGSYLPNAWGLYDMHGNVWEWVADWYGVDYYAHAPEVDPQGPEVGTPLHGDGAVGPDSTGKDTFYAHVYRGGNFMSSAPYCRSSRRDYDRTDYTNNDRGFRVALEIVAMPKAEDAARLREATKRKEPEVRLAAVTALYEVMGEKSADDLKAALDDPAEPVRLCAARGLAELGDRTCLKALGQLLSSADLATRTNAHFVLMALTGKQFDFVPYEKDDTRAAAARAWTDWIDREGAGARLHHPLSFDVKGYRTLGCLAAEIVEYDALGRQTLKLPVDGTPWGIQPLDDGGILVGLFGDRKVVELNRDGKVTWKTENLPGGPMHIQRLDNGNTLIACSDAKQVMEVDKAGTIVWKVDTAGRAVDARRLKNGHTLITTCRESNRVYEIDRDGKEVWKADNLTDPQTAQRLENGNTLIGCTSERKVVEIDPDGKVIWSVKLPNMPMDVQRLANGNIVVSDGTQVLELDHTGQTVSSISMENVSRIFRY